MSYSDMWTNNSRHQLLKAAATPENPENKIVIPAPPKWVTVNGITVKNKSRLLHGIIPSNVTHLSICDIKFDDRYRVYIPDSVKWLDISGSNYGNWFFYIPNTVETIIYRSCRFDFNSECPTLPSGLKVLDLTGNHASYLPELPDTLEVLILNKCMNLRCLPDRLPANLRVIDVSECPELTKLPTDVPASLKEFWVDGCPAVVDWLHENGFKWGSAYWEIPKFLRHMHEGREELAQERAQKRCRELRQEIVAAAYHPRRVEHWLEQRGWDILEEMLG